MIKLSMINNKNNKNKKKMFPKIVNCIGSLG